MTTTAQPGPAAAKRAVFYLRVSTGRQAEQDLSIPDQGRQAQAYCETRGTKPWASTSRLARRRPTIDAPSSRR